MAASSNIKRFGFFAYLATMFWGAFNDNASKIIVILFASSILEPGSTELRYFVPLIGACFILPYLLFSSVAGYLADYFSKRSVMIYLKIAELLVMFIGFLLLRNGSLWQMVFIMFLMGAQSAFFSPAKYGYLPETMTRQELSRGNGLTQLFTFFAIIFGGYFGGQICHKCDGDYSLAFLSCVIIAVLGVLTSLGIGNCSAGNRAVQWPRLNPFAHHWETFCLMRQNRQLFRCVFINTYFWFFGTATQLLMISYGQEIIHCNDGEIGVIQAVLGIGIGVGTGCLGWMSKGKIRFALIRPFGIAIAGLMLVLGLFPLAKWAVFALFGILGFVGGIYQLPASTAIQYFSPEGQRGQFISATNALDGISMLASAVFLMLFSGVLHLAPNYVFVVLGTVTVPVVLLLTKNLKP